MRFDLNALTGKPPETCCVNRRNFLASEGADFGMKRDRPILDLNCEHGEMPEAIADGTQESLMRSITSVNIASGGMLEMSSL